MKSRLLVTGASGLLGLNFSLLKKEKYHIIGLSNHHLLKNTPFEMIQKDFLVDNAEKIINEIKPDAILHCAAMANIDACENDRAAAERINGVLPGEIAASAKRHSLPMIYISTDAVFDGEDSGVDGYSEESPVNPLNFYAQTKYQGECEARRENPDVIIARVNFYGWSLSGKRSLSEIFYHNLSAGKRMLGFTDVFFMPLSVFDLSDALDSLFEKEARGLYHVFSSEFQSKYQFGVAIAEKFGLNSDLIEPVSWRDGGLKAVRSPNLKMNTDKIARLFGHSLPGQADCLDRFYQAWRNGLPEQIKGMN